MTTSNIAFLDERPVFHVREDAGDYDADPEVHGRHLDRAQGQIGDALNLAGLLLAALEDEGDARAMQIHTAVRIIEKKLQKAWNRLDRHQADCPTRDMERS